MPDVLLAGEGWVLGGGVWWKWWVGIKEWLNGNEGRSRWCVGAEERRNGGEWGCSRWAVAGDEAGRMGVGIGAG